MNLDRGLIKQQARALIKDKVMKLFITSFVVSIAIMAIGGLSFSITSTSSNDIFNGSDYSFSDNGNSNDKNYFNDFDGSGNSASDFENFGTAATSAPEKTLISAPQKTASSTWSVVSYPLAIARILLLPLLVSLSWYYVKFVNGREYELGEGIKVTYKEAFDNYGKKLGAAFLQGLIMDLLSVLFIIPGIIFYYSSYFTYQLICEYPELSPMQAIKLSKKIVKGHRSELFALDLSFIPWGLLCIAVFPLIYVIPYVSTTQALYYENFKARALQLGVVTEDDFLSDAQKAAKYSGQYGNPQGGQYYGSPYGTQQYAQPVQNPTQPQQNPAQPGAYYGYAQPPQDFGAQQQPQSGAYTQNQPQNTVNYAPNAQGYYPPQQPANPYAPTYFNPPQQIVQQPQPAYFTPDIPQPQDPEKPKDIYAPLANDTVNPPDMPEEPKQEAPQITITEPEEPQTPLFSETEKPVEPTEAFIEPTEPTEPSEPKDISSQTAPAADIPEAAMPFMKAGVFGTGTFNTAGTEAAADAKPNTDAASTDAKPDAENASADAKNDFAPQPSNSENDTAQ